MEASSVAAPSVISSVKTDLPSGPIEPIKRGAQDRSISWDTIATRVAQLVETSAKQGSNPSRQLENLSGLLRLQVDMSRYQLRVELVSKVSESAVASVRKLQQNQ
jgi:hypothetical protein